MTTTDVPVETVSTHADGVSFRSVSKLFELGRSQSLAALDDVNFDIAAGEFVTIIGPSGCGKSTALRMVAGLEEPSSGTVAVLGETPSEVVRAHRLGVAFQDHALLPWSNVRQNVASPFRLTGRRPDWTKVRELVDLVGLGNVEGLRPKQLSGGMRQRVSIARALALEPEVLLLDEPFGALDAVTRMRLNLELQRIWSQHAITTMMVTHSVDEAVFLSDRVIVMSDRPGTIVEVLDVPFDRPRSSELFDEPAFHQMTAQLTALLLVTDAAC